MPFPSSVSSLGTQVTGYRAFRFKLPNESTWYVILFSGTQHIEHINFIRKGLESLRCTDIQDIAVFTE